MKDGKEVWEVTFEVGDIVRSKYTPTQGNVVKVTATRVVVLWPRSPRPRAYKFQNLWKICQHKTFTERDAWRFCKECGQVLKYPEPTDAMILLALLHGTNRDWKIGDTVQIRIPRPLVFLGSINLALESLVDTIHPVTITPELWARLK